MAEKSILWDTNVATGDGSAAYTMAEVIRWMRQTFVNDNTDEAVLKNYLNELEVTDAGGTQVDIDTGGAYVYGFVYWNTASVSKTLNTPTANPRIDRIVLQVDWTAQTVRIAVIEGSEAASPSPPALTQTDGTKWEISLAQVQVTTGGDISSVTDERVFIHPNIEIEAAMMASVLDHDHTGDAGDGGQLDADQALTNFDHAATHQNGGSDEISVAGLSGDLADAQDPKTHASTHERAGSDQIDGDHLDIDWNPSSYTPSTTPSEADNIDDLTAHLYGIDQALGTGGGTKEFFVPATYGTGGASIGHYPVINPTSAGSAFIAFLVPHDFTSITAAVVAMIMVSGGTASPDIYSHYCNTASGEDYDTHSESKTDYSQALSGDEAHEFDISPILTSIASGDIVGIEYQASNNAERVLGVRFRYS